MLTIFDPLLVVIALVICITGFIKRSKMWMQGKPDNENIAGAGRRLWDFIVYGVAHGRILREAYPGIMHLFIFFACLIPVLVIVAVQAPFTLPAMPGNVLSLFLDIVGLCGLAGIALAAYRRYIQKPDRLSDTKGEDAIAIIWVAAILIIGFCIEGLRLSITGEGAQWAPVGAAFSFIFKPLPQGFQVTLHSLLWRVHFFVVLALVAALPYTKFLHLITSSINIFLRKYGPPGVISKIADFETAETFGVAAIEEFTRTQLFNLDACTRCGRCQDNCPAYLSEKPLSPKKLLQDLKAHMEEKLGGNPPAAQDGAEAKPLVGGVIETDTIWACTTCLACHAQCPVFETTVDKTIEMRRNLVLMESNFPQEVQAVFRNMENNSNPWGVGAHTRGDWAKEYNVKLASSGEPFEYLLYVGCAGAFDDRYKKVAIAVTKILQAAGIDFAILGPEEGCCGDSARRIGNEYLYDTLVQNNLAVMQGYNVKKIITMCPHCLNALKNEYPQHGTNFEVVHHSQLILQLIEQGRINLKPASQSMKVCYHDSCFLGRYNDIYDQPRKVLTSIKGISLVEMDRNRDRAFCCGAGGGRMWMEEHHGKRINEMRTDMALDKNPDAIATACPYCLTMLYDGLKVREKSEAVKSQDIAEFVLNVME
ncbi:MAG: 4Fe-4S dicluster domain-containing protein [Deltaproteobacteria bacterium]|nr:4Fe-4S dicluster domain-containing protein [Deltaproteobacteria bacterium]